MAEPQVMTIKRGDTWRRTGNTVLQGDGVTPLDLSGCTLRFQVRARKTGALQVAASTQTGEITITDAPAGTYAFEIPAATMASVAVGTHEMDVEITFADGSVLSSDTQYVTVLEDITRD
jgi:hypothetical protein